MSSAAKLQVLWQRWREENGTCVICGLRQADEKDHIPPRALFPKALRDPSTEFLTYPVCSICNRGSSDADFLLAFRLAVQLNQSSYRTGVEPNDRDLIELDRQITKFLTSKSEAKRRRKLLHPRVRKYSGTLGAIDLPDKLVLSPLLKMARALYWLKTDGDILEQHKPTWWVRSGLDTSTHNFAKHILSKSNASVEWGDRFVTRYNIAGPDSSVPGTLMAAFIFYSKGKVGRGYTWFVLAAPSKFEINGELIRTSIERSFGAPSKRYVPMKSIRARRQ